MAKATCKAKGCTNAAHDHGYCKTHYAESREPQLPWPLRETKPTGRVRAG